MTTYAIINNNKVENIIKCESLELATVLHPNHLIVEVKDQPAHIGLSYDNENGFEQTATEQHQEIIPPQPDAGHWIWNEEEKKWVEGVIRE
jgi:hypothetical protein